MHRIDFWFDPISPYVHLAVDALPRALEGISHEVAYRPLLLGAVLAHWGQKGPAEIEPKRQWTFRQVHWLAAQQGLRLDTPAQHPFNPLALLRLALACTPAGQPGPSRRVVQALLRHVWDGGLDANDPARLAALAAELAPELQRSGLDPAGEAVKAALRASTEAAIAQGVFGVPTLVCGGRAFFGQDALPMLRAALLGDPWFDGPAWQREALPRPGVQRR